MMLNRLTKNQLLKALSGIEYGRFDVVTPEGERYGFEGRKSGQHASIEIHDWSVIRNLASKGDVGMAEDYRDGLWHSDNLPALFMASLQNEQAFNTFVYGSTLSRMVERLSYILQSNTLKGSRKNIHAHYDLGNDFYSLWLDPSMTYSSALFNASSDSLEQAQTNKNSRILDRLNASSGRLLEVGCGWGGFAEQALQRGDFAIKGITLSEQQHSYATQRLNHNAEIALEDYRNQEGLYDYLVSIEMFEAVGERYWPTYFQKLKSLMKDGGKAVVQTITIDEKYFENYRKGGDMIRTFIFPGGMLPSPQRFAHEAGKAGLKVADRYMFGQDYATTLEHWLAKFDSVHPEVKALGFDDGFIRLWRFYLASCIATFRIKRTNVMQVELCHA